MTDERNKKMKWKLIGLALLGLAGGGFGQEMKMVKVEDLAWKEHPVFKGAQTAILVGDPTKAETIVQRTKFPPHYRVPPHTHPYLEVITVLSGNYWNSFGQSFDKSKGIELRPGSVFVLPAGHAHYTWTEDTEVVVQANFIGPGGVTFINPADDPRNAAGAQTRQSPDLFGSKWFPPALFHRPNQAFQPTTGWRVISLFLMQQFSIFAKPALASGG